MNGAKNMSNGMIFSPVAALFVRADSVYNTIPQVYCYDKNRDAFTYNGDAPVVCHPPCRSWGRYANKARQLEKADIDGFRFCIETVRRVGGVIEHPSSSTAWFSHDLSDFMIYKVYQSFFGHKSHKETYIAMYSPHHQDYLSLPCVQGKNNYPVESMGKKDREATPIDFAQALTYLARDLGKFGHYSKEVPAWTKIPYTRVIL